MKVKNGRNTVTNDIAYIAGFFDGEGCIRIKQANQGGNSFYIWVAITNSNKEILEWVASLFGGVVRRAESGVNKIIYHYNISSSEAVEMLKVLNIFLREKKTQAELAIWFHDNKEYLTPNEKLAAYSKMKGLKIIGNIYENPELLK